MIKTADLVNYTEAAELCEVSHATIRDLVKKYNLAPKRPPGVSGQYKGLDKGDLRVIRRALNMTAVAG